MRCHKKKVCFDFAIPFVGPGEKDADSYCAGGPVAPEAKGTCGNVAVIESPNIHLVYLALGTNLGQRQMNLNQALEQLPPAVTLRATSRRYETAPAYVLDQPAFLNIVVRGETALSPHHLLAYLKRIESHMGRQQTARYGPRLIDLDIIFYDDWVITTPDLQIPHPRLAERGFVLYPLADIAPELVHPVLNRSIAQLVDALPQENGILHVID